jgi:hypothetical protein
MMSPVLQLQRTSGTSSPARSTGVACVLVLVLVLLLAACSGGKKHSTGTTKPQANVPKVLAIKTSVLKVGKVVVESAGPQNLQMDVPTGKAVLAQAQKYIDNAMFGPLKAGRIGGGYASLFDSGVKSAALGADQRALTDLDAGKVARLTTKAGPVVLSALAGKLGELIYVATNFDLTVKGLGSAGPLTISHKIELTFAKTGKAWLVTAYRVQSVRHSSAGTTTTTAKGGTKP